MWLKSATGAFGHLLLSETTPIDLDTALKKGPPQYLSRFMPDFKLELIEGAEILQNYSLNLPEGAVT